MKSDVVYEVMSRVGNTITCHGLENNFMFIAKITRYNYPVFSFIETTETGTEIDILDLENEGFDDYVGDLYESHKISYVDACVLQIRRNLERFYNQVHKLQKSLPIYIY